MSIRRGHERRVAGASWPGGSEKPPGLSLRFSSGNSMPIMCGVAAVFNTWTEIRGREGHFMEQFAPGSFTRAIDETLPNIRCMFHHGQDPSVGVKPLGPIVSLRQDPDALRYEVQLLDTDYNRSLLPGIEAGLYGSSFRFAPLRDRVLRRPEKSDFNRAGIPQVTVLEATLREFGPTPMPAYPGTSATIGTSAQEGYPLWRL